MVEDKLQPGFYFARGKVLDTPQVVFLRGVSAHCEEGDTLVYVCDVVNTGSIIWQTRADLSPITTKEEFDATKPAIRDGWIKHHLEAARRMMTERAKERATQ